MTISIRVDDIDWELIKAYSRSKKHQSVSEYMRNLVMEDIENSFYELMSDYKRFLVIDNNK